VWLLYGVPWGCGRRLGPSVVISELLVRIDKSIDRRRAADRALLVTKIMKNVSFKKAFLPPPGFCLALLRRRIAQTRPRPGVGESAAPNLLAGPPAKVFDRIRDAVHGWRQSNRDD
jgi:hypothetical protein